MLPGIGSKSPAATRTLDRPSAHDQTKVSLPSVSIAASRQQNSGRTQQSSPDGRRKRQDGRSGRAGNGRAGGRRSRADKKRFGEAEGPGIRSDSRVGRLLAEFGNKDDWVSITIMRHQMAIIIQSCTRGFLVRQKWRENPQFVVDELHRNIEKERQAKLRREEAKKRLEVKLLTQKQKAKAGNIMTKLFGKKKVKATPVGKWGKLSRNVDLAVDAADGDANASGYATGGDDDDDSDFSDLELEDIAAVKLRARTPPWQKVEQSQWVGQYNKLNHRVNRGNVDVLWDTDECAGRLSDVKSRRLHRDGARSGRSHGHGGETDVAGAGAEGDEVEVFDPATQDLPAELIKELLSNKYAEKWARLGLTDYAPVRYGRLDEGLLDEQPMKILTTRLSPDDA